MSDRGYRYNKILLLHMFRSFIYAIIFPPGLLSDVWILLCNETNHLAIIQAKDD